MARLKLDDLKVDSFVTIKTHHLRGGESGEDCPTGENVCMTAREYCWHITNEQTCYGLTQNIMCTAPK